MVLRPVRCLYGQSDHVTKRGKTAAQIAAAVSAPRQTARTALPTASYVGPSRVLAAREREGPMITITLKALLELLLGMQGTFVLCNAHGSLEFKGQDLYLSSYQEWLTVYHATPKNPESQSHLHLKWHTLQSAVVTHAAGRTPYLAFYGTTEAGDEAPLIWYFPSFYNWANGKTAIPDNIAQYETFVTTYGTTLQLVEPAATE